MSYPIYVVQYNINTNYNKEKKCTRRIAAIIIICCVKNEVDINIASKVELKSTIAVAVVVVSAAGGNGVREERIQVTFVPKHKGDTSGAYTESGIAVDKVSSNVDQGRHRNLSIRRLLMHLLSSRKRMQNSKRLRGSVPKMTCVKRRSLKKRTNV